MARTKVARIGKKCGFENRQTDRHIGKIMARCPTRVLREHSLKI